MNTKLVVALTCLLGLLGVLLFGFQNDGDGRDPFAAPARPAEGEALRPGPAVMLEGEVPAREEPAAQPVATEAPAAPRPVESAGPAVDRSPLLAERPLSGRVVDETSGEPLADIEVVLEADGVDLAQTLTDADGRFTLLLPSEVKRAFVVPVAPEDFTLKPPELEAVPGADHPFFARRWPPANLGDVGGQLVSESGSFTEEELLTARTIVLDLISVEEPRIERRATLVPERDEEGNLALGFQFKDVPVTEYELTLSSLGSFRWYPTSVFLTPPMEGIEFLRYDLDRSLPLAFRVIDDETDEPIETYDVRHVKWTTSDQNGVLLHTGPLDASRFPVDAKFVFSLSVDGYVPFFGTEQSFRLEDGVRVAVIRLERGWGALVLAMGGRPTQPLSGVRIEVDGDDEGVTAGDGTLWIRRTAAPESLAASYRDWDLADDPLRPARSVRPERRGYVVPVLLRPPTVR